MDLNSSLDNIRALTAGMRRALTDSEYIELAEELAHLVNELDECLMAGAPLPHVWHPDNTKPHITVS